MFFLVWLTACFLVVGFINFYLRRYGLPKKGTNPIVQSKSTGYGSISFSDYKTSSSIGGLLHGTTFSRSGSGGDGESVHWVNSILSWINQTQNRVPEFVTSWLRALTTEAEIQSKELQLVFEGIHGSPPEFSNFRTESASSEKSFTILTTVTLKDVTFQTSVLGRSSTTRATQPVKCDVYIQNLTGQVKSETHVTHNELGLQLEFVSGPNINLQIRPTRLDYVVDNAVFEKVVRAAISRATMRVDWTSQSTGRPSHLRIVDPNSIERTSATRLSSGNEAPSGALSPQRTSGSLKHSSFSSDNCNDSSPPGVLSPYLTPSPIITQERSPLLTQHSQVELFRSQQPQLTPGLYQGEGQYLGQRQVQSSGQGQQYSPPVQNQQHPSSLQGQSDQSSLQRQPCVVNQAQPLAAAIPNEVLSPGLKLFIKVVKANGLVDTDFGNCSAFCRVQIDSPPQNFTTNVICNTVNPYWNEQFISEFDRSTNQIQFEVLDRDRQSGSDLLGKAIVSVDEIRRMPNSRLIIPLTGKPKSRTSTSGSVTVEFIFRDATDLSPSTYSSSNVGIHFNIGRTSSAVATGQKMSILSSGQLTPSTKADYSPFTNRSSSVAVGSGASHLSAHNLALTPSQPAATRPQESPTFVVTDASKHRSSTLQSSRTATGGTLEAGSHLEGKKKESFASTLKKTFGRVKIKPRSQSADRSTSRSLREGNLLKPPGQETAMTSTTNQQGSRNSGSASDLGGIRAGNDETLRKNRSNSFSSSLRRIFRRDKKDISREGSMTKPISSSSTFLGRGSSSKEALTAPSQGFDRSRRQNTPVPSAERFAPSGTGSDFPYSSSVPAASSPLQSR